MTINDKKEPALDADAGFALENDKLHIGCHLSSVKGFVHMAEEAVKIGADTFQFPEEGVQRTSIPRTCEDSARSLPSAVLQNWWRMPRTR